MKNNKKKMMMGIMLCIFFISGAMVIKSYSDRWEAGKANELASDLASGQTIQELEDEPVPLAALPSEIWSEEPLDEKVQFLKEMDLHALTEVNEDVLGWIHVPDTELSYPLLQTDNNETYLNQSWDGKKNSAGSIFLECMNAPDFSGFNTLIYGHRMTNNSMFGSLRHYTTKEHRDAHPYIYVVLDQEIRRYEVFSAYEAPVNSATYWLNVEEEGYKEKALTQFVGSSVFECDITPTTEDKIITLSTCTGTGTYHSRWVVQAVLTDRWEK